MIWILIAQDSASELINSELAAGTNVESYTAYNLRDLNDILAMVLHRGVVGTIATIDLSPDILDHYREGIGIIVNEYRAKYTLTQIKVLSVDELFAPTR